MSPENFRKIAAQAKPMTKQVCLHLMGEPLAHPQFAEIMQICDDLNLRIFLTTNGTLIRRHSEALFNWKSLDQINFSVHSYFANPEKLSLTDYMNPILEFCDKASDQSAGFYINLRLWNLEKTNLQKGQNTRVFSVLNDRYNMNINENVDILAHKSKKLRPNLYIHFDTEFIWPSLNQPIRSEAGTCYGLRKQLAVHANGDVVPCCLDKESVLKLGNIHEGSIESILKSKRSTEIKKGFENHQLVEDLCRKCQYADRFKN